MISHPKIPQVLLVATIPNRALEWRNSHDIRQWCRQYSLISAEQQSAWLKKIQEDPSIKMFGIRDTNGTDIGVCGLTSIDRVNQKAEISHYIAPKYKALKYTQPSLLLLMRHAFLDQNLNRVWAEVFNGNPITFDLSDMGFSPEGRFKEAYYRDGKFIDTHIWAMNRRQFHELYSDRFGHGYEHTSPDSKPDAGRGEPNDPKPTTESPSRRLDEAFRAIESDQDGLREITHKVSGGFCNGGEGEIT